VTQVTSRMLLSGEIEQSPRSGLGVPVGAGLSSSRTPLVMLDKALCAALMSLTQVMILVKSTARVLRPDRIDIISTHRRDYKECAMIRTEGWAKIREAHPKPRQELGRAREIYCNAQMSSAPPHFPRALHDCERFLEHASLRRITPRAHDRHLK